ncbi:MAG: hypothetical protein ABSB35_24130 [Bryobacteraceae bacterium]|jgi:hypothetical protein
MMLRFVESVRAAEHYPREFDCPACKFRMRWSDRELEGQTATSGLLAPFHMPALQACISGPISRFSGANSRFRCDDKLGVLRERRLGF